MTSMDFCEIGRMGVIKESTTMTPFEEFEPLRSFRVAKEFARGYPFLLLVLPVEELSKRFYRVVVTVFTDRVSYLMGVLRAQGSFPTEDLNRMLDFNLN